MFVGVQVTPWSKQLEAQHPGCIFWSSLLTHIIHPFKWGHNLFFLRSLLHAQWLACWQLIPEKTTAHEQFIWLCFQHWHLFHHPCDGYTLRFQILRVMTSSAPRDRRWFVCHDPWVRPQVSVDSNHDMKWVKRFENVQTSSTSYFKNTSTLLLPQPLVQKKSTVELHQASPYAGLLDPSFTLIQELQMSKTL